MGTLGSGRSGLCVGTRVSRATVPGAVAATRPDVPGVHPACTGRSSERVLAGIWRAPRGSPKQRPQNQGSVSPRCPRHTPRLPALAGGAHREVLVCREPGEHDPLSRRRPPSALRARRGSQRGGHRRWSAVHATPGPCPRALPSSRSFLGLPPSSVPQPHPTAQGQDPCQLDAPEPRLAQGLPGQLGPGRLCDTSPSGLPARGGQPGDPRTSGECRVRPEGPAAALQRAEARRALTCRRPGSSHRSPGTGLLLGRGTKVATLESAF